MIAQEQSVRRAGRWAIGLLLIGFALRVWAISTVPPGLTHDEVSELDVAQQVYNGEWRLLYTRGYGVEPGYYPLLSASQSIWGVNLLAMRWPSIVAGMIGLACTYALAARLFGQRVGLITLGAAAVTWWSIVMGRAIEREILEVPLYALALSAFWRGFEPATASDGKIKWRPFILGGVALGAAQYVHTIPRGLFIVFALFGVYLWLWHRSIFKRVWRGILVLIIVAEVIAAPLLITAALEPEIDRLPTELITQPDESVTLIDQLRESIPIILGQFMFSGDATYEFNIPGRPVFEPIGAALFALGLLVALFTLRRPASAFVLIVFGVSLLPSIFLDVNFPFARLISAQTVAFIFVGLGADAIGRGLDRLVPRRSSFALAALLIGGLLINFIGTAQAMFNEWPSLNPTRSTYQSDLRALGRYLAEPIARPPLAQCTLWIEYPWAPKYHSSVAQASVPYLYPRRELNIRWHDCRYALVIPNGGQFIFAHPDIQPLADFLGRFLKKPWLENAQPIDQLSGALHVDVRTTLAAKILEWSLLPISWPPEAVTNTPAQLPIDFDHAVQLIGYRLTPANAKPGGNVSVVTYWRVLAPLPADLIVFTHLYRTPDEVLAQQDQLDVASDSLQPGDVFVQQHEFITVPPDTAPGQYWIGIGLYHKDTGTRLPVFDGDHRMADRILLIEVRVQP